MIEPSDRGRITPPNLDDRTWADLVAEMTGLIDRYTDGWTDRSPSDIGMTLVELFGWLGESVIYRLNRVPEKNYLAFLRLMGVTRVPARPARTHLRFTATQGPVSIRTGTQAQTPAQDGEEPVVFETDEDVLVLPIALRAALLVDGGTTDVTTAVVGPPATRRSITVPPDGGEVRLLLGFDAATTEEIRLGVRLFRPVTDLDAVTARWTFSGSPAPADFPEVPGVVDGTEGLRHDGTVRLSVPATWTDHAVAPLTEKRFWLGLVVRNGSATEVPVGLDRVLFNAASARTALTLRTPEVLGTSDGGRFRSFALTRRPLHRRPDSAAPYADLKVEVGTGTPPVWTTWTLVDDPPPEATTVFWADPVTGEIRFGGRDATHPTDIGDAPPAGAEIRATYRYVAAGQAGDVAAGQITTIAGGPRGEQIGGVTVVNPWAADGGVDEEPLAQTLRAAPERLVVRDRAVTVDDYEALVPRASDDVRIWRCLPPRLRVTDDPASAWQLGGINRAPGVVNVIVVPDHGRDVPRPRPTPELVGAVRRFLDRRRDLLAQVEVTGPRYLPVVVTAELRLWPRGSPDEMAALNGAVRDDVLAALERFLHPVHGGPDGTGWRIGQPVLSSDVFRAIKPQDDVGYVASVQVDAGPPDHPGDRVPTTKTGASVRPDDYQLVCAATRDEQASKITVESE